jgi:hypothetical protein
MAHQLHGLFCFAMHFRYNTLLGLQIVLDPRIPALWLPLACCGVICRCLPAGLCVDPTETYIYLTDIGVRHNAWAQHDQQMRIQLLMIPCLTNVDINCLFPGTRPATCRM